jgi:hypothetical protein
MHISFPNYEARRESRPCKKMGPGVRLFNLLQKVMFQQTLEVTQDWLCDAALPQAHVLGPAFA